MRKKTALRTRKHRKASSSQQSGLVAREKNAKQSAKARSALDNHFHRTDLGFTCAATNTPGFRSGRATRFDWKTIQGLTAGGARVRCKRMILMKASSRAYPSGRLEA